VSFHLDRKRQRRAQITRLCLVTRLADRALDRRLVAAQRMHRAVDHRLRGVDLAVAARLGVSALTVRMAGHRQRVFPAEIVPVVDGEAHHDHRRIARKFAHQLVGRRTRRAALAGEQLDHGARLGLRLRTGDQSQTAECER
jgi:hypothetical protein